MDAFNSAARGVIGLGQYVREGFEAGTERRKKNRLAELAGDYYGGQVAPDSRQQWAGEFARAGGNPQPFMEAGQQAQDRERQELARTAAMLVAAPPAMRPAIYQSIAPKLASLGFQNPPAEWSDDLLPVAETVAQQYGAGGNQRPAGLVQFEEMTRDLSPEDKAKALRVQLGLEARPSSAAPYGFQVVMGSDGVERLIQTNKLEGGAVPVGVDRSVPPAPSPNPRPMASLDDATLDQLRRVPPGERAAMLQALLIGGDYHVDPNSGRAMPGLSGPPAAVQPTGPNPFAGVPKDEMARRVKEAEGQAAVDVATRNRGDIAGNAAAESAAKAEAEARVKLDTERVSNQRDKDAALRLYQSGMTGVKDALEQTSLRGPIVGRLPALTTGQQIADGGVSAIAPVLKQLFRVAGEGTFTDKDQALLLSMIPTRTDTPDAAKWKIANIDALVAAKLAPVGAAPPASPPAQDETKTINGRTYIRRNGQWYEQ